MLTDVLLNTKHSNVGVYIEFYELLQFSWVFMSVATTAKACAKAHDVDIEYRRVGAMFISSMFWGNERMLNMLIHFKFLLSFRMIHVN